MPGFRGGVAHVARYYLRAMRTAAIVGTSAAVLGLLACKGDGGSGGGGGGTAAGTATPATDALLIRWKAPAVGSVQDSVDDLVQHLTIHDPTAPDPLELTLGRHLDKRTKVVEITGGVRTKVEVTYRDASESQQVAGGDDASRPLAVAGKSYLVWIEGGEGGTIRATAVDGGDVGDAERELLVEDHEGELGRMPGMAQVIVGRPWTQGQAVALADDERREVAAAMGPGTTVDGISITWTGTEAGVASFAVDMQVVRGDGADQMKTSSHAVVRLDVGHARPVEVTAHAQISGQRSGATVEGTMEAHTVNTYPEGP